MIVAAVLVWDLIMASSGELVGIARHAERQGPLECLDRVRVTQRAGLDGDCRGRTRLRQVTVVAAEAWEAVCRELDAELSWTLRRANLLVKGVSLPRAPGARLEVGDLWLEVTGETAPCARMDEQLVGLRAALRPDWRGGITCRVLNEAEIRLGDAVSVHPPNPRS